MVIAVTSMSGLAGSSEKLQKNVAGFREGGARPNRLGEPNGAQQARARLVLARRQRTLSCEHRFGYEKDPRATPSGNPACLH